MASLAPDIIKLIIQGQVPESLTLERFKNIEPTLD